MKVLITGAAGFIGSQLAYFLYKKNVELIMIDNFSYGTYDNLIFTDCDFSDVIQKIDIRDQESITKIFKNNTIDFIYNFAGIAPLPDCQENPQEAFDVNVTGLVNLLEVSRRYGVKKLIQASTNALYENTKNFPTKEDNFPLPTLIYPTTKYVAERVCQSFTDTYGMNITCLRLANVYGPHIDCLRKHPPFVGYMIRELYYERQPIFHSNGEQRRDYIYIEDVLKMAIAAQNTIGFDCVNVASGQNYSVKELYEITKKIMNKDIDAVYRSSELFWDKYPLLKDGVYKMKTSCLEHEVNKCSCSDITFAKDKYNWSAEVSIEDGLKSVILEETKMLKNLDEKKN